MCKQTCATLKSTQTDRTFDTNNRANAILKKLQANQGQGHSLETSIVHVLKDKRICVYFQVHYSETDKVSWRFSCII